jgi:hypothetical protein
VRDGHTAEPCRPIADLPLPNLPEFAALHESVHDPVADLSTFHGHASAFTRLGQGP